MKTVRLGCTDIGAILFAGIDDDHMFTSYYWLKIYDDNSLTFSKYATTIEVYQNVDLSIIILVNE